MRSFISGPNRISDRDGLGQLPISPGLHSLRAACGRRSDQLARVAELIGIGIKRRIEIDEIDTRVGKFFPIRKPFQIVAKIEPIHSGKHPEIDSFISRFSRRYPRGATVHVARPTRSILRSAQNDKLGRLR